MKLISFLERIVNAKHYKLIFYGICIVLFLMSIPSLGANAEENPREFRYGMTLVALFGLTLLIGLFLPKIVSSLSLIMTLKEKDARCACCGIEINQVSPGGYLGSTNDGKRLIVCNNCVKAGANKFSFNKITGVASIQSSETDQQSAIELENDQRVCANLEGFSKFDQMQTIEERNADRLATIAGKLGSMMMSGAGQEREHDWAIHGGLASGAAGPLAGLAVAADTIVKNQQIRERNALRYQQGVDLQRQSLEAKFLKYPKVSEKEFNQQFTVDLSWSPDTLFSYLSFKDVCATYDYKSKSVKVDAKWERGESAPCIDGAIRAKIYDVNKKCVGCANLVFSKTGTGTHRSGSLSGVCLLSKRLQSYDVVLEPVDLWELAPKGKKVRVKNKINIEEHAKIVKDYKTRYRKELNS